jgi:hypothetical protein
MSPRTKTKEKPLNQLNNFSIITLELKFSFKKKFHSGKSLGSNQTLSFSPKSAEFYTLSSRKPSQSHASHL